MNMDSTSITKSCSRDNSNLRNVFRSDDIQLMFARGSQESTCSSRHILTFAPNNRDTEIDHDEFSISRSSDEHNNTERVFVTESRDPEEYEDCSQTDSRSTDDCERTEPSPTRSEIDTCFPSRNEDSGARDFFLSSGLKRANPIYESESEAEHLENNHYMKRRRSIALGKRLSSIKPLFWAERLTSE